MDYQNNQTLSTQGDTDEREDQLGGTTNLSLDQLKEEGGIADPLEDSQYGLTGDNDLNGIRAADDQDEPDEDEYDQEDDDDLDLDDEDELEGDDDFDLDDEDDELEDDEDDQDLSVNDADGTGGYPDENAANPAELNS